jgi:hypothetical protein
MIDIDRWETAVCRDDRLGHTVKTVAHDLARHFRDHGCAPLPDAAVDRKAVRLLKMFGWIIRDRRGMFVPMLSLSAQRREQDGKAVA